MDGLVNVTGGESFTHRPPLPTCRSRVDLVPPAIGRNDVVSRR